MARYSDTLRDDLTQAPVEGALVSVIDPLTALALPLTADVGGALDNPFPTDEFGSVVFNIAADAVVDLEYHYGGRLSRKDYGVVVGVAVPLTPDQVAGAVIEAEAAADAAADSAAAAAASAAGINTLVVPDRATLAAIVAPASGRVVWLNEAGREGWFRFSTANLSANVTADPAQALYVPPAAATSGASGAWVRVSDAGYLNTRWFGATGNGTTDDTTAVQRAINYACGLNVAKIFFPAGIYLVSNLSLPALANTAVGWKAIELAGVSAPSQLMGTVISGTQVPSSNGSIIKSAATSGSILSVLPFGGGFSMYQLVVRDLTFRAPDNPAINGIDAGWSAQFSAYNLHIETGVYNMLATAPSHVTCGIIAPNSGNGGVTRLQNVDIGGFFVGIKVNEHTWGDYINLTSCKIGLDFILANDTSLFGRIAIQNCPRPIAVDGRHHFDIAQLMIEHLSDAYNSGGTAWMFPLYDIDDAGNNGFGNIRCEIVKGDVGPVDLTRLIKNGGGHIHVQRVGDPPIPAGYHNIIATSVPSSAVSNTPIPWAAGGGDPGLAVDGTDNTRLVCNIAGLYGFDWLGAWTPNATGTVRRNNIVVNATDLIAEDIRPPMAAGFGTTHSFTCSWVLALGDYIQLFGKQDSGGALVLQSTSSSGLLRHRRIAAGWT